MPPNQCVNERQNAIVFERASMPSAGRTVEPVVVNPEADSKNASTGDEKVPANKKGKAPASPAKSHETPTTASPSRRK